MEMGSKSESLLSKNGYNNNVLYDKSPDVEGRQGKFPKITCDFGTLNSIGFVMF